MIEDLTKLLNRAVEINAGSNEYRINVISALRAQGGELSLDYLQEAVQTVRNNSKFPWFNGLFIKAVNTLKSEGIICETSPYMYSLMPQVQLSVLAIKECMSVAPYTHTSVTPIQLQPDVEQWFTSLHLQFFFYEYLDGFRLLDEQRVITAQKPLELSKEILDNLPFQWVKKKGLKPEVKRPKDLTAIELKKHIDELVEKKVEEILKRRGLI